MDLFADASGFSNGACAICVCKASKESLKIKKRVLEIIHKDISSEELEYRALVKALSMAKNDSNVYCDNLRVVDEVLLIRSPNPKNIKWYNRARKIIEENPNLNIMWIPREKNIAGIYLDSRLNKIKKDLKNVIKARSGRRRTRMWRDKVYGKKR